MHYWLRLTFIFVYEIKLQTDYGKRNSTLVREIIIGEQSMGR